MLVTTILQIWNYILFRLSFLSRYSLSQAFFSDVHLPTQHIQDSHSLIRGCIIPSLSLYTFSRKLLSPKANNLVMSAEDWENFSIIVTEGTDGNKQEEKNYSTCIRRTARRKWTYISSVWLKLVYQTVKIIIISVPGYPI